MKVDFIYAINNVLEEQGKTIKELFDNEVISENTFYKYKHRFPSLKTLLKVCNYLKVSIDFLFEISDTNNFRTYTYSSEKFYNNIIKILKNKNISGRKFCQDLKFSADNLIRWKKGTTPSLQSVIEIVNYFDCSLDDLLL